jgi:lipopolysaccharide heptosyltransferase II
VTAGQGAPRRLVIIAPNWLGDAVMALPVIADVQRAWPETHVAVAARRSIVPLFEMAPGISHTVALESGARWRLPAALARNATLLAAGEFDAALLLPNSFQSAWMVSRARIPERWGFRRDLRGRLLTRALKRPPPSAHQAEYYQALATGLGLSTGPRFARLDVSDDDRSRARQLITGAGLERDASFVVFAPGAAYGRAKQWPPQRFAELAGLILAQGMSIVLIGTAADADACREVAARTEGSGPGPQKLVDLAGRTDLTTLAGLLAQSRAVVANDSGAMHLAAASAAPVVAIFGPTNERQTAPLSAGPDAPAPVILFEKVWCRPCMLRECPIDHRCMTRIGASAVLDALG